MLKFYTTSEDQTLKLAAALAQQLDGGVVLALSGPLGSGKTCFVRGVVRGLSLSEQAVSSPTFLICQEYRAARAEAFSLAHIDAYRLHDSDELESIGWDELLAQKNLIIAIEWAERIEQELPEQYIRIEFEHTGVGTRSISIESVGGDAARFRNLPFAKTDDENHPCPICSASVAADVQTFPFCSQRCRMVDLGKWFSGSHVISRPVEHRDFDE